MSAIKLTIWNEFRHEKTKDTVKAIYPDGMHFVIGEHMKKAGGIDVRLASLDEPEHGLTQEVLDSTDVLIWWGHAAHIEVQDEIVDRVHERVLKGMGLVVLHSGHHSKIFKKLMGTTANLRWREAGEKEILWVVNPYHPITRGIPDKIQLQHEEMYGELFDIPAPDELIFIGWFEGGETFRSGCTWTRGLGKIFYFQPGHETYPTYKDENILKVIENGVRWAKFEGSTSVQNIVIKVKEPIMPLGK